MPVLELRGITKSFPGVKANQDKKVRSMPCWGKMAPAKPP